MKNNVQNLKNKPVKKNISKRVGKIFLFSFLTTLFIAMIVGAFFVGGAFLSTENVFFDKEKLVLTNSKITLYDSQDNLLTAYADNVRHISIDELNDYTKNAFISIEDKSFYSHKGINPKRMVKALLTNIKSGYIKEGASTISQQLIKNTHLKNEKTYKRKIKEIMLTTKLENTLSKDEILETYLNVIYFGNASYGIESASQNFFGKSAKDLTLAQSALLAGVIKSPVTYSPVSNPENAIKRRNLVLDEMKKDGYISENQLIDAKNEKLEIIKSVNKDDLYSKAVLNEATKILSLSEKLIGEFDYKIYTYLDSSLQNNLDTIINDESYYHVNSFGNRADSSAIVMDNYGHIVAFSGKSDADLVNLKRSPASAIKPILCYTPAIENNLIAPASIISDEKINIMGYSPNNVGNTFSGNVTVRYAVEKSLNIPSVKILQMLGIEKAKNFARKVGIQFDENDNNYALALGAMTNGVNLKDLTGSYTTLANNGNFYSPTFIRKIEDSSGKPVYFNNIQSEKVISDETSYLMTDILRSSVKNGTSKRLSELNFDVAGKTGTQGIKNTNLNTDAYSIGYTTEHIVGVWLGNPTGNNQFNLEGGNNGGTYATSILRDIMKTIYSDHKPKNFTTPAGIEKVELDSIMLKDGVLAVAGKNTPDIFKTSEIFSKNNMPLEKSTLFDQCMTPELNCKVENGKVILDFDTVKINRYYLYKEIEDQTSLVLTIDGNGKNQKYIDSDVESETLYSYFVRSEIINPLSDEVISSKSNKVRVLTD